MEDSMARIDSAEAERDAMRTVAALMCAAARTAPKARGIDAVETLIVEGQDLETLAAMMDESAPGRPGIVEAAFHRDAAALRKSACAVLIGVTGMPKKPENPFDCGACGFRTCEGLTRARRNARADTDFFGPACVYTTIDLGAALASAVKAAASHNVDNRMMYTMGVAAARLKWLGSDIVIGIPLSTSGKNIYFDRV
jgi:uncharacterized ferredoxin-like protein